MNVLIPSSPSQQCNGLTIFWLAEKNETKTQIKRSKIKLLYLLAPSLFLLNRAKCSACADKFPTCWTAPEIFQRYFMYQNYLDLGQCYLPQPSASADNIDLGLNNSGYPAQPHPIIVNNCTPLNQSDCSNFVMYGNFERKLHTILDLAWSNCNGRPSGRNRTCGPAIPVFPGTPELGGGGRRGSCPVALYQEGQGGQRCPFNLKDCLGEIANCQKSSENARNAVIELQE